MQCRYCEKTITIEVCEDHQGGQRCPSGEKHEPAYNPDAVNLRDLLLAVLASRAGAVLTASHPDLDAKIREACWSG